MPKVPELKPGELLIERGAEPGEPFTVRILRADDYLEVDAQMLARIREGGEAPYATVDGDRLTVRDSFGTTATYRIEPDDQHLVKVDLPGLSIAP
jgi:hypothetical protein